MPPKKKSAKVPTSTFGRFSKLIATGVGVVGREVATRISDSINQPFRFSNSEYLRQIRESSLSFANHVKFTAPAQQLVFLNRKLGGMFHLLKDLNAEVDLSFYWKKIKEIEIK